VRQLAQLRKKRTKKEIKSLASRSLTFRRQLAQLRKKEKEHKRGKKVGKMQ
jgi:hypothetical protein